MKPMAVRVSKWRKVSNRLSVVVGFIGLIVLTIHLGHSFIL